MAGLEATTRPALCVDVLALRASRAARTDRCDGEHKGLPSPTTQKQKQHHDPQVLLGAEASCECGNYFLVLHRRTCQQAQEDRSGALPVCPARAGVPGINKHSRRRGGRVVLYCTELYSTLASALLILDCLHSSSRSSSSSSLLF